MSDARMPPRSRTPQPGHPTGPPGPQGQPGPPSRQKGRPEGPEQPNAQGGSHLPISPDGHQVKVNEFMTSESKTEDETDEELVNEPESMKKQPGTDIYNQIEEGSCDMVTTLPKIGRGSGMPRIPQGGPGMPRSRQGVPQGIYGHIMPGQSAQVQ